MDGPDVELSDDDEQPVDALAEATAAAARAAAAAEYPGKLFMSDIATSALLSLHGADAARYSYGEQTHSCCTNLPPPDSSLQPNQPSRFYSQPALIPTLVQLY